MYQVIATKKRNLFSVDTTTARRLVLNYAEKQKVNYAWLATKLGKSRQQIRQWILGENSPSDDSVWIQIATTLGLNVIGASDIAAHASTTKN